MSHHKLTDEEKFHVQTKEEVDRWGKIYDILEDMETRLKILETKIK